MVNFDYPKEKIWGYVKQQYQNECGENIDTGMRIMRQCWENEKGNLVNLLARHPEFDKSKLYIKKLIEVKNDINIYSVQNALNNLIRGLVPYGVDLGFLKFDNYERTITTRSKLNFDIYDINIERQAEKRVLTEYEINNIMPKSTIIDYQNRILRRIYDELYKNIVFGIEMSKKEDLNAQLIHGGVVEELNLTIPQLVKNEQKLLTYNKEIKTKARAGMKWSKYINSLLTELGLDKLEGYQKGLSVLGDHIMAPSSKHIMTISVNPVDFQNSSYGVSWHSCHRIGGEYQAGPISYMCDGTSFVVSLYSQDEVKNWEDEELGYSAEAKTGRIMFHYEGKALLQSRLYPDNETTNKSKVDSIRQAVQEIIATCEELKPVNGWVKIPAERFDEWKGAIASASNSAHYKDYYNTSHNPTYSYHKVLLGDNQPPLGRNNLPKIHIGVSQFCLSTGDRCSDASNLVSEGTCCCADCGYEGDEDDMFEINGEWYCNDCCFYCEHCECHCIGCSTYVEGFGDVCEDCRDNHYSYCENCGDYVNSDDIHETKNGRWICSECLYSSGDYIICEHCGDIARSSDAEQGKNDEWFCEDCIEDNRKEE